MNYQLAGSIAGVAYFPTESELSRRVRRLIKAATRRLEVLCKSINKL